MNTQQKIESVKMQMPDESPEEVKRIVKTVNWLNKWDGTLRTLHQNYIADTGKQMDFMEFAMYIHTNNKNMPSQYVKYQAKNN